MVPSASAMKAGSSPASSIAASRKSTMSFSDFRYSAASNRENVIFPLLSLTLFPRAMVTRLLTVCFDYQLCFRDIARLGALVSAAQYDHCDERLLPDIHAISWAIVDPHLADSLADRLHIASVAFLQPQ